MDRIGPGSSPYEYLLNCLSAPTPPRIPARRVCFLEEGRIIEDAPPAELFTSPKDERTQRFLRRIVDAGRL